MDMFLILPAVLFQLFDLLSAQLESSMGIQSNSNLEARPKQLSQCLGEWQWPCRNGECIARYDVCDGIPQCSDGSDEWNCENWRERQNQYDGGLQGNVVNRPVPTTKATSTTAAPENSSTWLPTKEEFLILAAFAVLAVLIVTVIRRRARAKVLARNRRGNLLQADSDEDDILISSMYS